MSSAFYREGILIDVRGYSGGSFGVVQNVMGYKWIFHGEQKSELLSMLLKDYVGITIPADKLIAGTTYNGIKLVAVGNGDLADAIEVYVK